MKSIYPSGRSLGVPEDDVRFALSIARQGSKVGFATRSSRRRSDDEEEEREERPRYSGSQVSTSWLIAGFVAAVGIVVVLIVWNRGSQENLKTFQEFQDLITIQQGDKRIPAVMSAAEFITRVGQPLPGREFDDANCFYMYFKVREGLVEVAMDKPSWKRNVVRIVRITMQQ